ncbi:nucleotidyltransferase domain-containing protein [Pyrobaculum sp. 3827-6]|uniref:nucleotidyltransferase domain-containing protein n=1 Tax=Pyrobaculum sp. 3827-6 TaxID=2983604 RepID=UPI0021DA8EFC|nr:nucleotidyltransferase domain-containing protein [Pyrobaculum sp. 3827-6]MCU7788481.1 nucleotidyltransferase domain-containing protein [Pyrobaculum sp. 3827-6]
MLEDFPWQKYGLGFAVLFGSRAGYKPVVRGDWDIAVWPDPGDRYGDLVTDLAARLGVREEDIDIVVLDEDTPCALVLEIAGGRPLYYRDLKEFLDVLYFHVNVCIDHFITLRKVEAWETQLSKTWRS